MICNALHMHSLHVIWGFPQLVHVLHRFNSARCGLLPL